MKKLILFAALLGCQSLFADSICDQSFRGMTGVLGNYTDTVVKCLNRYPSSHGNLASTFEALVEKYHRFCVESCDSEKVRVCDDMLRAKDDLKAASPYECTR